MKTTHIKNLLTGRLYPATDFHFSTNQIDYVDPGTEYCEELSLMNGEWEYVEQEIVIHIQTLKELGEEKEIRSQKIHEFTTNYWKNEPKLEGSKSDFLRHIIMWHPLDSVEKCIEEQLVRIKERVSEFDPDYDEPEYLEIWKEQVQQLKNLSKEQLQYMQELLVFKKQAEIDRAEFEKTL